jgi:GNAT superfamily N-acetyltransferase
VIQLAKTDDEIRRCYPVMKQLRTHLVENEFVGLIRELMADGYQLAYLSNKQTVACVAGFKLAKNLFLGKNLYVEDLVTDANQRSSGYGKQMMDWLRELAINESCNSIHLDSGVQRHGAHRFYLNQNMDIVCYHFLEHIQQ